MTFRDDPKSGGIALRALRTVLVRKARRRDGRGVDVAEARASSARLDRRLPTPRGVRVTNGTVAGVPVAHFTSGHAERGTVLSLHGGAYVSGTPRGISVVMAAKGGPDVVSVDYRLSPENPHSAAVSDAMAVYRHLLETVGADRLAVTGDSAGGGLALLLLQAAAAEGLPMPAALVAMYPWADLSMSGQSVHTNALRDILVVSEVDEAARWFARELDRDDPAISPLFASFRGFPRTYIAVGSRDLILDDARRVADRMRYEGVDVHLDVFPDAVHGFNAVPVGPGKQCNDRARSIIDAALPQRDTATRS